ncbi:MAG: urease accessory protein UreF [Lentilitoribacter sp.]
MTDKNTSLLRLMAWLSPVFPIGSFAYSAGLEQASQSRLVTNAEQLFDWLSDYLNFGSTWNDAVYFSSAWHLAKDGNNLVEISALAEAMASTKERHQETIAQGAAFLKAANVWDMDSSTLPNQCALPIAVGARCANAGIELSPALLTYLQAFVSNQLQVAIRLSIIGQNDALKILARFEPLLIDLTERASQTTLDDLGSFTITADISSLRHETMESRIFQS